MPSKGYSPAEIVNKLREAKVLISQGQGVTQVCKRIGVVVLNRGPRRRD